MVAGSLTCDSVSPVPPARLWKAHVFDVHHLAPKILPHIISTVVVLQGDGGVGTVKQINFTDDAGKGFSFVKYRIDVVDHENYTFKFTVLDGGLVGVKLKTYTVEMKYEPTSEGGSKIKLTVDYDTLGNQLLNEKEEEEIKNRIMTLPNTLAGHLMTNPNAYV